MVLVKIITLIWSGEGRVTKIVSGGDLSRIALSEMQVGFVLADLDPPVQIR